MLKINKSIIIFSILLLLSISISSASASNNDNNNITFTDNNINNNHNNGQLEIDSKIDTHLIENNEDKCLYQDHSPNKIKKQTKKSINNGLEPNSLEEDNVYHINNTNFDDYFIDGVLKNDLNNPILIFNGEFADKNITINSANVKIIGENALFNNTVFCLEKDNILLANLNFILTKEFPDNDHAGILILKNNITIYNCTMTYNVPNNTTGFCIYGEGVYYDKINGLQLINNSFNFYGNNLNGGWDYGIFLDYTDNAVVYGNTLDAYLPLRTVDWSSDIFGGVTMDSVGAFVAQQSNNLSLTKNKISTHVTCGGDNYPTLDTILLYACNNAIIEKNSIYSEDYDSKDGKDNYLYGMDIYFANDITIIDNQIHIRTTGGRAGNGAAYPIQVSGPSYDVKIAYNNISTVNAGPNVGIYSQNARGETRIQIINNFINVTGLASTHYWALVAGIEVQDSDDIIWNNTIIVNNIGEYKANNNIYGISYSQNTKNNHTYNIQYNNVTTNGKYAVSLSGTESLVINSIVANNVLNSFTSSGNRAVRIGKGVNNTIRNNTDGTFKNTLSADKLPDWLKNYINKNNGKNTNTNSNGSGLTDHTGNGVTPWSTPGNANGLNNGNGHDTNKVSGNGTNNQGNNIFSTPSNNTQGIIWTNSSSSNANPGASNSILGTVSAASPSDTGSSSSKNKAYEVKEKAKKIINKDNYIPALIATAILLLLIFAGYKRKNNTEEE